jgi:hypothetical protein
MSKENPIHVERITDDGVITAFPGLNDEVWQLDRITGDPIDVLAFWQS